MPQTDFEKFLYRLHAYLACGVALLLTAYSAVLAFERVPRIREILVDFDTPLPAATEGLFHVPWLPAAVSLLALSSAIAAVARINRKVLAGAWALVLLSLAVALLANYALNLPLHRLIGSMTGDAN